MSGLRVLPEVRRVETLQVMAQRGAEGNPKNPLRWVWLYYSIEGELLACYDPINGPPDAFNTPAEPAKAIELATHGAVQRHELRPDIFDPPATAAPVSVEEGVA